MALRWILRYFGMKKRKMPENLDIVGNLLSNYGMTGENLVRDIFSYMDVSSIQGGRLVCKTWNLFLINDRKLWIDILRQTQPFFEFVSKQLLKDQDITDEAKSKFFDRIFSEKCFDFIQEEEDFCCQNIIKTFKRIQMIHIVLQDVIQDCPVYEVFQKKFIGGKLVGEIQLQIDGIEKKKQKYPKMCEFESDFSWLLEIIINLKSCRGKIEDQKRKNKDQLLQLDQNAKNINDQILELIEARNGQQLLLGIQITLFEAFV